LQYDTEIKIKGLKILAKHLGDVEAERFIALIQREPFDYTKWRQGLDEDLSIEEISKKASTLLWRQGLETGSDQGNWFR
jgi:hypothetical protein